MSNQSIFQQLQDQLGHLIAEKKPGDRLPSEPALAQQLGVSRATLREAMRTFETHGLIRRQQGSGTYVTHPSQVIASGLEVLESIHTMAERTGLTVYLGFLDIERRMASDEERRALDLIPHEEVICVTRVICAEDRPVAYLVDSLPIDILEPKDLDEEFTGSILDFLIDRGEPKLQVSRTEINAVTATSKVARALGIQRGVVLLRFISDVYSTDSRVVDHSHSYFLPGYFCFHVVRRVE